MHRHKTVAQILLILSILNSVLAAPVVVREMPEARGAVAVRVPAEGVVAVLEKRIEPPDTSTAHPPNSNPGPSTDPDPHRGFDWKTWSVPNTNPAPPDPYKDFNWETWAKGPTPEPQPGTSTAHPPNLNPNPNPGPSTGSDPHKDFNSETSAKGLTPEPQPPESQPEPHAVPSKAAWRQKLLTPENAKAVKYAGVAGLLTAAYMGLVLPTIMKNDGKDSQS